MLIFYSTKNMEMKDNLKYFFEMNIVENIVNYDNVMQLQLLLTLKII